MPGYTDAGTKVGQSTHRLSADCTMVCGNKCRLVWMTCMAGVSATSSWRTLRVQSNWCKSRHAITSFALCPCWTSATSVCFDSTCHMCTWRTGEERGSLYMVDIPQIQVLIRLIEMMRSTDALVAENATRVIASLTSYMVANDQLVELEVLPALMTLLDPKKAADGPDCNRGENLLFTCSGITTRFALRQLSSPKVLLFMQQSL